MTDCCARSMKNINQFENCYNKWGGLTLVGVIILAYSLCDLSAAAPFIVKLDFGWTISRLTEAGSVI